MIYGIKLIGVDHVSLGSDFDGTIEPGFDTSELQAITHELIELGLEEVEIKKLHRMILGMSAYLNANNINYIIFNSLPANLDGIRDKINFMSFNDDDYSGRDTWNDFLMWQMEHIDGNKYNDEIYRSPKPPYGKQYCNGHPSPNAIKKLLIDQIYSTVKWRESLLLMEKQGSKNFIEIGPGKSLIGMVKRTIKNSANCFSINSIADIKNSINEINK